jgi:hypothetical protein
MTTQDTQAAIAEIRERSESAKGMYRCQAEADIPFLLAALEAAQAENESLKRDLTYVQEIAFNRAESIKRLLHYRDQIVKVGALMLTEDVQKDPQS